MKKDEVRDVRPTFNPAFEWAILVVCFIVSAILAILLVDLFHDDTVYEKELTFLETYSMKHDDQNYALFESEKIENTTH